MLPNDVWIFCTPEDGVMSVNMSTCVKSGFIRECHQIHNSGWIFVILAKIWQHSTRTHFCTAVKAWMTWMWYGHILRSCVKIRHTVFCGIPVSKLHRVVDFDGLCDMACCTTAMFRSLLPVLGCPAFPR